MRWTNPTAMLSRWDGRTGFAAALGLVAILAMSAPAAAGPACREQPALVALSQHALSAREAMPRFPARRIGTLSAFLLIRYGALTGAEASKTVDALVAAKARRADELSTAYRVANGPVDPGSIATIAASQFHTAAQRVLIRSNNRALLLDALAASEPTQRMMIEKALAIALIDLPDAEKTAIAGETQAKGLDFLTAGILATVRDRKPWTAFLATLPPDRARGMEEAWYWIPAVNNMADLPRAGLQGGLEAAFNRTAFNAAFRIASRLGEADFTLPYINQTGDLTSTLAASAVLLPAFGRGEPDPLRDPAAGWLATYRALVTVKGPEKWLDNTLAPISLTSRRHHDGAVLVVLRWASAARALGGAIAAGRDLPQTPPAEIATPGEPDWSAFRAVAAAVAAGDAPESFSADPAKAAMAAEILFAAGRGEALPALITAMTDKAASAVLAEDFALRIDRRCAAHAVSRGEAVFYPGEPLLRFD
ncbi:MAG: hypothetical protein ACK50Q_09760 [Labrys sp. (in: a-proteobacteria)]